MTGPGKGNFMTAFFFSFFSYINFCLDLLPAGTKSALCSQPAAVFKTYVVGLFFDNSEIVALTFTGVLSSENNFSVLLFTKKTPDNSHHNLNVFLYSVFPL